MATTATRQIQIVFSGDVVGTQPYDATDNVVSPAFNGLYALASGDNAFLNPSTGAAVATAVTVVPPFGNTTLITLKGVNGDTGIPLHPTDPTSIAIDPSAPQIVLNAADDIDGVRVIWS